MQRTPTLTLISMLFMLAGCSATAGGQLSQGGSGGEAVIEGLLTAPLPGDSDCKPLGFPITLLVSGVFVADDLVEETATPTPDGTCEREQVLAAPADTWAALAYGFVCQGLDDAQLCGASERRRCAVDLLRDWAEGGERARVARDPIYGLAFSVPHPDATAQAALAARAEQEVHVLLDEIEVAMDGLADGTRDCPGESLAAMAASLEQAEALLR